MCGIVAIYNESGDVDESKLLSGLQTIAHRGPDGEGTWINRNRTVGLGHVRLSIIDLENGSQPIANETNDIHVVVNGEFYDYETTRDRLHAAGHRFRTRSDSEIALHLYESYEVESFTHLRGEFAFIIWDEKRLRMVVARDRFGIKPLYYSQIGSQILFASEIKALIAMGVQAKWNHAGVCQTFSTQFCLQDETLFGGIQTIPPGHYALVEHGELTIKKYWDLDYPHDSLVTDEQGYLEQFHSALCEAIKIRLRADVPVACYLSGGLDSSVLAGITTKVFQNKLKAYTVTFDHEVYSEEKFALETAETLGLDIENVRVTNQDIARHFADAIWHAETLAINGHGVAKYLLSGAVRRGGHKVVLTGEGADEILAGYLLFLLDACFEIEDAETRQNVLTAIYDKGQLFKSMMMLEGPTLNLERVEKKLGFVPAWIKAKAHTGYIGRSLLNRDIVREAESSDSAFRFLERLPLEDQVLGRPRLHQTMYLYCKGSLPNYVLTLLGDRMEMAHSVEARLPFLDHKLFELIRRFPPNLKIRNNTEKYILKQIAKPYVAPQIVSRPKHGFITPMTQNDKRSPLYQMVNDVLQTSPASVLDKNQLRKVLQVWNESSDLSATAEAMLMMALSASILEQRFRMT